MRVRDTIKLIEADGWHLGGRRGCLRIGAGARGRAGGDRVCGKGRFFKKVFNLSKLTLLVISNYVKTSSLRLEEERKRA